jgi:proline iminopeptidase
LPPVPPPRASGLTATTEVPLYWAAYGSAQGQPLLLLHGGPGASHEYLLPQMLRLDRDAARRNLLFYDQRGGGQSRTDSRDPITWRTQVGDMARVATELGAEPLVLIGYSWGGLLAMLYAIEAHADPSMPAVQRMVLLDPAPVSREWRADFESEFARRQQSAHVQQLRVALAESDLRQRDPDAYRQRAFELSVAGYFADPAAAHDLTPFRVVGRVQESIWASLGDYDLRQALTAVHVTTLVIHGRQDPIPLASSEAAARALGAELTILDDCGHVPYVEQPDALFAALEGFLAPA